MTNIEPGTEAIKRHVIVPDLDYHAGMETMSGEIWAPPPSLCKLMKQRLQVGDVSSLFQCARFRTLYEGEGINIIPHAVQTWLPYGSQWIRTEGFGAKSGVHQISVHAVHIIVMGSDQQHALSLNIPSHHLEYFHRGFVARSMYYWTYANDASSVTTILLLLSGFAVACMTIASRKCWE